MRYEHGCHHRRPSRRLGRQSQPRQGYPVWVQSPFDLLKEKRFADGILHWQTNSSSESETSMPPSCPKRRNSSRRPSYLLPRHPSPRLLQTLKGLHLPSIRQSRMAKRLAVNDLLPRLRRPRPDLHLHSLRYIRRRHLRLPAPQRKQQRRQYIISTCRTRSSPNRRGSRTSSSLLHRKRLSPLR